ncbi:facilitated trehalose transporter Tret1-2 homolog [Planococcus citri]|uniref:facilitated trehalose transporter Tret1-2 homolog n=1 Tax=Planococcus citri TaxID=170843 RepID=UPI0031F8D174
METNGKIKHDVRDDEDDEKQPLLGADHKEPIWRQYIAAMTAALLSMATGCCGGWSSSAVPLLMEGLASDLGGIDRLNSEQVSWVTSLLNLGSLFGSIPAGQMSFYFGRRKFLLMLGGLLVISWMLIIWNFNHVELLYLGRFLAGFCAASCNVALAMYSNEICSDKIRGQSGSFYDLMQVFGILFVYSVSAITTLFWSSMICLMVPVCFVCVFYWMPESPLHLIKNGYKTEAIKSIRWLHGEHCDVEKELTKIYLALLEGKECEVEDDEELSYLVSIRKFYNSLSKTTIKAFAIVLSLFVIQRSSGAPMVVYYTVDVFESTNASISPLTATVCAGASQLFFSIISVSLVDRVGRKILIRISCSVMILCLSVYVTYMCLLSGGYSVSEDYSWLATLSICLFVGIYRLGISPIPFFLCTELVPVEAQKWALPKMFFIGWGVAFIWSKSYLAAVASFGYVIVFLFFMFICLLGLLITLIIPETKNKSRLEIQAELGAPVAKYVELKSNAVIIIED